MSATDRENCAIHEDRNCSSWCWDCEQTLCAECSTNHYKIRSLKCHSVIPIIDYQKVPLFIREINTNCKDHVEKLEFYCSAHDAPCCYLCMKEDHHICSGIQPLQTYVENIKASFVYSNLKTNIHDLSNDFHTVFNDRKENLTRLQLQKAKIVQEICNMRKSIDDSLDKLEKTAIDELTDEYNTERLKIENVLKECNTNYKTVQDFQENINELTLHATQLQTFLHAQTIKKEIKRQIEFLESLQKNEHLGIINLAFSISPFISSLTEHLDSFGTVSVNAGFQTIFFNSGDQMEAQLFYRSVNDVDNLFIERKSSFTCCFTESCALLPNAQIVHIAQGHKSLHISDLNGSNRREIELPDEAWGVVHMNDTVVAVTFFKHKRVASIEINEGNIIKTFKVEDHCHGIKFFKDKFLLYLIGSEYVYLYSKNGRLLKQVKVPIDICVRAALNDNRIFFIDFMKNIHCCDFNGSVIWTYQHNTHHLLAEITVDENGFIFAACLYGDTIVSVSSRGKSSKDLLSNHCQLEWCDNLACAKCHKGYRNIEFDICNSTKQLIQCSVKPEGSSISVYDIKYR
ncbi:uncharacterized protein LOC127700209 [Mytilus californianus]|uniref:uncharacterized protein LOC127700209 n=1 Tax=Mytilus californianus TaxID=6549 RepID=UPI002246E47F|nr:uncharacterized protein LOC127700209 [Mytilus californianus]